MMDDLPKDESGSGSEGGGSIMSQEEGADKSPEVNTDAEGEVIMKKKPRMMEMEEECNQGQGQGRQGQGTSSSSHYCYSLKMNSKLNDPILLEKMRHAWEVKGEFHDTGSEIQVSSHPFQHAEIPSFIEDQQFFMKALYDCVNSSEDEIFKDKASDLFQFKQSDDLKFVELKEVQIIREFFETQVLEFMSKLTGYPLNGTVDMFLSDYQQTDFLLCHDDELESRRIAFMLYLSPDWKPKYGGSLDLFNSAADISPGNITKSVIPAFNEFVFFSVSANSFHQVSEVTQDGVRRLALSGWFYGDPLLRQKPIIPTKMSYCLEDLKTQAEDIFKQNVEDTYVDQSNHSVINEQLEDQSEVLLHDFFKEDKFKAIMESLETLTWSLVGPVNIQSYMTVNTKLWPEIKTDSNSGNELHLNEIIKFFHSNEFLGFLEAVTEFPFTTSKNIRVTSELRKYSKGSYTLLSSRSKPVDPDDSHIDSSSHSSSESGSENEEDANIVDLIYFAGNFDEWDDSWGGLSIYSDKHGNQLMAVTPHSNGLALIVRTSSVNSYVNYINCLAKDNFYSYNMTFLFQD